MYQNRLIREIRLISKFMTSQPGKQTITTHKLTNIRRSKGNQAVIFDQLTESNMRDIFHEKSYFDEITPTSFSKKSKLSISLGQ